MSTTVGRPRVLDEIKKREVCALLAAGGTMRFAAKYVDCHVRSIRNEARRDPEFAEKLREAQLSAQLEPLRALRRKATTHWRAAAWLLERSAPEQFATIGQKYFKPQDVADLLENVRATLKAHIKDFYPQFVASEVIDRVISEAGLPKGRACMYAKLSDLPVGLAPDLIDPFQARFPGKGEQNDTTNPPDPSQAGVDDWLVQDEEETNDEETAEEEKARVFSYFREGMRQAIKEYRRREAKESANSFPDVGTPPDGKKLGDGPGTSNGDQHG